MDDADGFTLFRACAAEVLEVEDERIEPSARFADDLEADSLDLLELGLAVEETFGVRLVPEELTEMETVGQVFDLLAAKLGDRNGEHVDA